MKKFFYTIIFLAASVVFFHYGGRLSQTGEQTLQSISQSPALEQIKQEVLTSTPLLGSLKEQAGLLSNAGVIDWTNQNRLQNGQLALKENAKLDQAAANKLKDMFDKQYFEHVSPIGKGPGDLALEVQYAYISIGENLALGNYASDQALLEAWMNSPGHRANILNSKFTEIGVAVGTGLYEGKQTWLAVQEFGKPVAACPGIDENLKPQITSYQNDVNALEPQLNQSKAELDGLHPQSQADYDAYNQKVAQYNALVKIYNNKIDVLKRLVANYNSQVNAYNVCAEK